MHQVQAPQLLRVNADMERLKVGAETYTRLKSGEFYYNDKKPTTTLGQGTNT